MDAVTDVWDPKEYDEIVVSTLPGAASKWLQFDVPHRIARVTGVPVRHVLASDRREPEHSAPPTRERSGVLSTFLAKSRAANFGFCRGRYSKVFQSIASRSSWPASLVFL